MPTEPPYPHPPLRAERIAAGQYDRAFLEALRANGQVRSVGADWNGRSADFPPHVTHVLHPNGDLERIGMS